MLSDNTKFKSLIKRVSNVQILLEHFGPNMQIVKINNYLFRVNPVSPVKRILANKMWVFSIIA